MAITAYKTPGVYVEEVSKLPPSVAVETAIPVFIGHTEKADDVIPGDLNLKPKRISSLAEYERYFGKVQREETVTVAATVAAGVPTPLKAVTTPRCSSAMICRTAL